MAVYIFQRAIRYRIRRLIRLGEHQGAESLLSTSEEVDDNGCNDISEIAEDTGETTVVERVVARPTKFRKWVVALVRAEHGTVRRTEANRLMISKTIRDLLAQHDVRRSQWHKHVPVIEAMYFIPCDAQMEARQLLGSSEALLRDELVNGGIRWWWWFWGLNRPLEYSR